MTYEQANSIKHLAPEVNKVLEGLEVIEYLKKQKGGIVTSWKWQPKVGEWFLYGTKTLGLITDVRGGQWISVPHYEHELHKDNGTPILHWEEIERVLEKAGCTFRLSDFGMVGDYNYRFEIWAKNGAIQVSKITKTRQEAVMKAVLELGKTLKC